MKYRIAGAVVDFDSNRIERADRSIELEPRVADVLRYLVRHAGQVVTREALLEDVWNTQNVSDDAVTRCINLIRRSFGDSAREPRVLQTLTKRGYRLIADVEALDHSDVGARPMIVRMPPERTLFETAAACSISGGASLAPRLEAFLSADMTRAESDGAEAQWRGNTYSVSLRTAGDDVVLRVRRPSLTFSLPLAGAVLGFVLAWMALQGVGSGTAFALPAGQIIAGGVFAALLVGSVAWFWKERIDRRHADDVVARRDLIVAAILR